jgi:hypothetical protein
MLPICQLPAGTEVIIVCNLRGLWLRTRAGSRIDFRGYTVADLVAYCRKNCLTLRAILRYSDAR